MSTDVSDLDSKSTEELEELYDALLSEVPSRAPIFTPTNKMPLKDRIRGMAHVRQIYRNDLDEVYRGRLRELRERHKGTKRCFLIGNGPSLNETDLAVLKDEVTFAVNGFFLKARHLDWTPTYYCVEDHLVAEDRAPWIAEFEGPIKLFPAYLGYVFPPGKDTIFYNHCPRKSYPNGFDFSMNAEQITYTGCTVTFSLMQLAVYMGFEEIYLIGVDASYDIPADVQQGSDYSVGVLDMKSDDPNHFDPDYFGKGFRWHDPQVHKMVEAYSEARRTLEGTGQTIYNATIGGKLEVFDRRSFYDLFPQARPAQILAAENEARLAKAARPRMLVIDMTRTGDSSATGALKATLMGDWPSNKFLQVSSPGSEAFALVRSEASGSYSSIAATAQEVRDAVADFNPEIILYRPLPDRPLLHSLAMELIAKHTGRLAIWLMDDWPTRLAVENPMAYAQMDVDLRDLLQRADMRLSISEAMSVAFEARYEHSFQDFANAVDINQWADFRATAALRRAGGPIRLRYAGGIAHDMNAHSLERVAQAVEALADAGHNIRFEIMTRDYWKRHSGHLFDSLHATHFVSDKPLYEDYAAWLVEADALVVAYNFDEASSRYIRYSMANKLPECLAAGVPTLVHGPRGLATVDYVVAHDLAQIHDTLEVDSLGTAILSMLLPDRAADLITRALDHVAQHKSISQVSAAFIEAIKRCCNNAHLPAESWHWNGSKWEETKVVAANLVILRAPHVYLAAVAEEGASASQAIENWCAAVDDALARLQEEPQACAVVMIGASLPAQTTFPDAFVGRMGPHAPDRLPDVTVWDIPVPALHLAAAIVDRAPQIAERLELLAAVAIAEPGSQPDAPCDDAMGQVLSLARDSRKLAAIEKTELPQLKQAQENHAATQKLLYAQIAQLKATLDDFDRQGELDRKAMQLQNDELAVAHQAAVTSLKKELGNVQQLQSSREHEIMNILRTRSWRLTRPLRVVTRVVKRSPALQKNDPKR